MTHHHATPFEFKFMAATGTFEGYASVFNVTDAVNDIIAPGAFAASLLRWKQEGRLPPLLWQHDMTQPIGAWRDMAEDDHGLFARGELFTSDIPRAREAHKLLQEDVINGLSIGYRVLQSHIDETSGVRVLTEIDLLEVSIVTFPANDQARIESVKTALMKGRTPSIRLFEKFLRDAGFSRRQAKGIAAHGYKALSDRPVSAHVDDGFFQAISDLYDVCCPENRADK